VWNPEWDSFLKIGGVGIFEVLVVVLFWHPFMSFILPVGVAELLTSGRKILPDIVLRHPYLTATLLGIVESSNAPTPLHSFLSTFSSSAFLIILIYLWLERFKGKRHDMKGLLPTSKGLKPPFIALLAYYLIFGSLLRREALPEVSAQVPIWLLYAATFFLLYRALKKSREHGEVEIMEYRPGIRRLIELAGVFVISATIFTSIKTFVLPGLGGAVIMTLWAFAGVIAVVSLGRSARWAFTQ